MSEVNFPINSESTGATQPQEVDGKNLLIRNTDTEQDWFVLAQKLRHHNQDLVRTIVQLEQTLAESQENLHQQISRSQELEKLIAQQSQQVKDTQNQINQIIKELQGAHNHNHHQQHLINKLSEQLQTTKEEKQELESQVAHLEEVYREQCYLITGLEQELAKDISTKATENLVNLSLNQPNQSILDSTMLQNAQPLPVGLSHLSQDSQSLSPSTAIGIPLGISNLDPVPPLDVNELESLVSTVQDVYLEESEAEPSPEVIAMDEGPSPIELGVTVTTDEPLVPLTVLEEDKPTINAELPLEDVVDVDPGINQDIPVTQEVAKPLSKREIIAFPLPKKHVEPPAIAVEKTTPTFEDLGINHLNEQTEDAEDAIDINQDNSQVELVAHLEELDQEINSVGISLKDQDQQEKSKSKIVEDFYPTIDTLWESLHSVQEVEKNVALGLTPPASTSFMPPSPIKSFAEYLERNEQELKTRDILTKKQDTPPLVPDEVTSLKSEEDLNQNQQEWNYRLVVNKKPNSPSPLIDPQRSLNRPSTPKRRALALPKLPH
jgi:hypothetical protein